MTLMRKLLLLLVLAPGWMFQARADQVIESFRYADAKAAGAATSR